jgi:hypothetical protein
VGCADALGFFAFADFSSGLSLGSD